jgi:hypothetical protein
MTESERLPPLPSPLRAEARRLRTLQPSPDFQTRLHTALLTQDAASDKEPALAAEHSRRHWLPGDRSVLKLAALGVPMLASAVLIAHAIIDENVEPQRLTRTIEVTLDDQGQSWFDLGLVSQPHNGRAATLHVEVPSELSVLATDHVSPEDVSPRCAAEQCMYRFTQPAPHPDRVPVQIGISAPGEYKIRVKHVSQVAHVQEDVLVRASSSPSPDSGR